MYYVRIAKALPQHFEMCMMLCRTAEKARYMHETYQIPTTVNETDIIDTKPDFIVIAAYKNDNLSLSLKWIERGFHVIQETPASTDLSGIEKLRNTPGAETKLIIAEQYRFDPYHSAIRKLLERNLIGEPQYLYLSAAHDYHAASLMRFFLNLCADEGFSINADEFTFLSAETRNRYEEFKDGRTAEKKRTIARFSFDCAKVCLYDFDSDQYRSPLRSSHLKIQGVKGEISDRSIAWMDEDHIIHHETLNIETETVRTDSPNPNLAGFDEIREISFGSETLYTPPFGLCGLSADETAVAILLKKTDEYVRGMARHPYPLKDALADSLTAIRMRQAAQTHETIRCDCPDDPDCP